MKSLLQRNYCLSDLTATGLKDNLQDIPRGMYRKSNAI